MGRQVKIVGTETLSTRYITAEGDTYTITVTYDETAKIPHGSELEVREILKGTDEYNGYLEKTKAELGIPEDVAPVIEDNFVSEDNLLKSDKDVHTGEIVTSLFESVSSARYFDISIVYQGEEIEPASAVEVTISYDQAIELEENETVHSVHFAEEGIELTDLEVEDSTASEFTFVQNSFSVTGTVVASASSGNKYYAILDYNNSYFAINANGSLTRVNYSETDNNAEISPYNSSASDSSIPTLTAANGGTFTISTVENRAYSVGNANGSTYLYRTRSSGAKRYVYYNGYNLTYSDNGNYSVIHFVKVPNPIPIGNVTIHYVDSEGNPIEGIANKDISLTTDISESWNHYNTYTGGSLFDLVENIEGYTYDSTHLVTATGTKINAEVLYQNSNWKYTEYGKETLNTFSSGSDVYVVYKKGTGSSSGGGSGGGGSDELDKPHTSKDLHDNEDGTSTLSLSISGSTKDTTTTTGANVILVFDKSTSMNTTRLTAAKKAARAVATKLLGANTSQSNDPLVEMCIVPLSNTATPSAWYVASGNDTTTETSGMNGEINKITTSQGTNWEKALQVAKQAAATQLAVDAARPTRAEGGSDHGRVDDTYIIFITDGQPSLCAGEESSTSYSEANASDYYTHKNYARVVNEAREIVESGYELYSIGIYGTIEVLHYLTDYAYTGRSSYDASTSKNAWNHFYEAGDETSLLNTLGTIASKIEGKLSIAGVSITDGIATSVTSTNVTGNTSNFNYKVTNSDSTTKYTVSIDENGTATFKIGNETYSVSTSDNDTSHTGSGGTTYTAKYENKTTSFEYKTPAGETATKTSTNAVYTVTIGTGENARIYTMSPATVDNSGEVKWELSGVGTIENGETWTVSFVVWPDQEAYDIVADLNNGVGDHTWNETGAQEAVYAADGTTFLYWKNGINGYEHIVKYDTNPVTYGALTNTSQSAEYYVYDSNTKTYTGPLVVNMETPPPMDLSDADASMQKVWDADMQPASMVRYLYDTTTGDSAEKKVNLEVYKGTSETPYTTKTLGWNNGRYNWLDETLKTVSYGGREYQIGTTWQEDLSISVGLMLSEAKAEAYGLTGYPTVNYGGETYYILDPGNDYTIKEGDFSSTQFDLVTETYHPMLKDGELYNLTSVSYDSSGNVTSFDGMEPLSSLVATNKLRGGINISKTVKDTDGEEITDSSEEFNLTVSMKAEGDVADKLEIDTDTNEKVAWYQYYKNDVLLTDSWVKKLADEGKLVAWTNAEGVTSYWGKIVFNKEGDIYTASGQIPIKNGIVIRFTNMATGTQYNVVETVPSGYEESHIYQHICYDTGSAVTTDDANQESADYYGTVIADQENNVSFTNTITKSDLVIIKTDKNNTAITSENDTAVFKLTRNTKSDGTGAWENATADSSNIGDDGTVTINTTEGIKIEGLKDGLYQLQETKSPDGYIINAGTVYFKLSAGEIKFVRIEVIDEVTSVIEIDTPSGYIVVNKTTSTPVTLRVANTPGQELPMTGGPGTTLYTLCGFALIIASALMYGFRMRRRERRLN